VLSQRASRHALTAHRAARRVWRAMRRTRWTEPRSDGPCAGTELAPERDPQSRRGRHMLPCKAATPSAHPSLTLTVRWRGIPACCGRARRRGREPANQRRGAPRDAEDGSAPRIYLAGGPPSAPPFPGFSGSACAPATRVLPPLSPLLSNGRGRICEQSTGAPVALADKVLHSGKLRCCSILGFGFAGCLYPRRPAPSDCLGWQGRADCQHPGPIPRCRLGRKGCRDGAQRRRAR